MRSLTLVNTMKMRELERELMKRVPGVEYGMDLTNILALVLARLIVLEVDREKLQTALDLLRAKHE